MEKDLVELFEAVKKAAAAAAADSKSTSSPEEDRCLDALKQLKKFPVTYQILVSSQVGKRLRQLTKHPRKKIQALASDVVEMWKAIIVKETSKNKKNGTTENEGAVKKEPADLDSSEAKRVQRVNSIKSENSSDVESVGGDSDNKNFHRGNPVKAEKVSTAGAMKVEKVDSYTFNAGKVVKSETSMTEVKTEKVDVIKTETSTSVQRIKVEKVPKEENSSFGERIKVEKIPKEEKSSYRNSGPPKLTSVPYCKDDLRDKFRDILADGLCKVSSEIVDTGLRDEVAACDPYRVALLMETSMFERWGRTNGPNKFKYRSIMFNIRDPNNPDFRRKMLLGIFPPHSICDLTPDEMASDARKKQNEKIKEKALLECERGAAPKASTDQFKCGRCGKRETTYYQLQTRSADEPMTTFVTCVNCNNHWKFC